MVIKLWVEKTFQKQMPFRLPRAISFQRCCDDSRGSRNSETRAALLHSGRERLVLDKPDNVAHFEEARHDGKASEAEQTYQYRHRS